MKRSLLVVVVVVGSFGVAAADRQKSCPDAGEILVSGACVKKQVAARNSALEGYQQGLEQLAATKPKQAFETFDKWCKAKHGPSCTQLGLMHQYSRGRVVRKNEGKASELFQQACDLGDGSGCRRRGMIELNNSNLKDEPKLKAARKYLEKGCDKDEPFACSMYGKLVENALGGAENVPRANQSFDKARRLFNLRCAIDNKPGKRDGEACWQFGYIIEVGYGEKKDEARALKAYQLSCESNFGFGCMKLIEVLGKTKPKTELFDLYRKACRLEVPSACATGASEIANRDNGKSTEPAEMAQLGCDLDPKECGMLGELSRLGWSGKAKDESKATEIYKASCDAGEQFWCLKYGVRLYEGTGVTADKVKAKKLVDEACKEAIDGACEQQIRYLRPDEGGNDADDASAHTLATTACKGGSQDACFLAGWGIRYNRRGKKLEEAAAAVESLPLFEQACTGNIQMACFNAGRIYERALGVPADPGKAIERFKATCYPKSGSAHYWGCKALSTMTPVDNKPTASELLRAKARACGASTDNADCYSVSAQSSAEVAIVSAELDPVCASNGDDFKCYVAARTRFGGNSDDKAKAYQLLDAQCKAKSKVSCIGLADCHFYGIGTPKDTKRAETLYGNLCDDTYGYACLRLAEIAREAKDEPAAFRHAERSCKHDHGDGCNQVGFSYHTGRGVEWDVKKGFAAYKKGCELGTTISCANQAEYLRYGIGIPADPAQSFKLYQKACDDSGTWGCAGAAHFIATGEGGAPKNVKRAIELYRKACDNEGEPESCVGLAAVLELEKGNDSEISNLRTKGRQRVQKAAEDNPAYMYFLGTYYRDGIGSPKDPQKAREWFAKACDGFDPLGCLAAGETYGASDDPADLDKARAYFDKGCGASMDAACKGKAAVIAKIAARGGDKTTPGKVQTKPGGCCGGEVAPGSSAGLALVILAIARRRRASSRRRA